MNNFKEIFCIIINYNRILKWIIYLSLKLIFSEFIDTFIENFQLIKIFTYQKYSNYILKNTQYKKYYILF